MFTLVPVAVNTNKTQAADYIYHLRMFFVEVVEGG